MCSACAQCRNKPPCAESCYTSSEPWWPDDYPNHHVLYPTSGYKCTSIAECLGCPACTGKPNIFLILADDVGIDDIASTKLPPLKNINTLKAKSMSFRDAHTQPLCAPSRYVILSGRLPFRGQRRTGTEISAYTKHVPMAKVRRLTKTCHTSLHVGEQSYQAHGLFGAQALNSHPDKIRLHQF